MIKRHDCKWACHEVSLTALGASTSGEVSIVFSPRKGGKCSGFAMTLEDAKQLLAVLPDCIKEVEKNRASLN